MGAPVIVKYMGYNFGPTTEVIHSKLLTDSDKYQKDDIYMYFNSVLSSSQLLSSNISLTYMYMYTLFSATIKVAMEMYKHSCT